MNKSESQPSRLSLQETWLRGQGLPFVVPARRRRQRLLPRTSAVLITFTFFASALLLADAAISGDNVIELLELLDYPSVLTAFGVAAVLALLAIPAGLIYGRWQRALSPRARIVWAATVWFMWLVGLSLAASLSGARFGLHLHIFTRVLLLLVAILLAWLELDRIVAWASRRSLRELAATLPAVARILPLLMITVLLVFFTGELWQVSAVMTKIQMWALGLFLSFLILLVILPTALDMIDDTDLALTDAGLLDNTPFTQLPESRPRLSLGERLNLLVCALALQTVQVTLFVVVTFGVFAIFGSITLTPKLIESWAAAPSKNLVWLGLSLPMDAAMFRVCLILALFSGLSFAASTLTDSMYRELFIARISQEVRRNVAARHCYRRELLAAGELPTRWLLLVDDFD